MIGPRYKVRLVVDRQFGERLATLEKGVPVWIVDTPTNKPTAHRLWQTVDDTDHLTGITTFSDIASATPSELLLAEIDTIDLHHGPYSADPPYSVLEVIGAPLSEKVKNALSVYGFDEFNETSTGFVATRPEVRVER